VSGLGTSFAFKLCKLLDSKSITVHLTSTTHNTTGPKSQPLGGEVGVDNQPYHTTHQPIGRSFAHLVPCNNSPNLRVHRPADVPCPKGCRWSWRVECVGKCQLVLRWLAGRNCCQVSLKLQHNFGPLNDLIVA